MSDNHNQPAKPLSLWEKIKTGAVGFVKSAISYLPSGLMFAGLIMGGSALLGVATGKEAFDILHVAKAFHDGGVGAIATKMALSLALGSTISGGMGAWKSVQHATQEREALRAHQTASLQRCRSHCPELEHALYQEPLSPQRDLPHKPDHLHTTLHSIH